MRKRSTRYGDPVLSPESNTRCFSELNIQCEYYDNYVLEIYLINGYKQKQSHYNSSELGYVKKESGGDLIIPLDELIIETQITSWGYFLFQKQIEWFKELIKK